MTKHKPFFRLISVLYDRLIVRKKHEIMFWVLGSFFTTFIVARLFVIFSPQILGRSTLFIIRNTYVHHFVYGFFITAVSGLAALNNLHHRRPRLVAILFGMGLGIGVDEFALMVRLDDVYWARLSYNAIIVVGSLLFSLVYFRRFWMALWRLLRKILVNRVSLFLARRTPVLNKLFNQF
jgi:hypothetical protein